MSGKVVVENYISTSRVFTNDKPKSGRPKPFSNLPKRQRSMNMKTSKVVAELKKIIKKDSDYAWGWHCNVAMAAHDEGLEHYASNRAAARFMKLAFDIDMTKHEHFPKDD